MYPDLLIYRDKFMLLTNMSDDFHVGDLQTIH